MKFNRDKLIELRKSKGLRQNGLAARLGVKPPVVHSWESGKHIPSGPMLIRLSHDLGVAPDYFFDQ